MKTLAERLKWARERIPGLTQGGLAARIGRQQGYIGNLEAGTRHKSQLVAQLAKALGVDAHWLATGEGEPFSQKQQDDAPQLALVYASQAELRLLTAYRETDETGRAAFETLATNVPRRKVLAAANHKA